LCGAQHRLAPPRPLGAARNLGPKNTHIGEKVPGKQPHSPMPEASMRLVGSFQIDSSL
jgi:hypothetical protein